MAEINVEKPVRRRILRHRGRSSQVLIYLGKQLRFFINENDWKVLPMAAIIAALVGMVIRNHFFIDMEGSLFGGFSLTCVAIWNGSFNSIQAVCRERPIIKREHRSGLHITSYVTAHMIYQFFLCAAQTGLSMYVLQLMGVKFPKMGIITPWMIVDMGISMLLITYASDMMSLFISSFSHTTTGAMTVMPFVLIFQLVFSGGLIPLPSWSQRLSDYTISNYGIKAIVSQTGYNQLPMEAVWKTMESMKDSEVGGTVTMGQILDLLDNPVVERRRGMEVLKSYTVSEAADILNSADEKLHLREKAITLPITIREIVDFLQNNASMEAIRSMELAPGANGSESVTMETILNSIASSEDMQEIMDQEIGSTITLGQVLDALHVEEAVAANMDATLNEPVTLGDIVDFLKNNEALQAQRDRVFTFKTNIGELFDLFGKDNVKKLVQMKTAAASWKAEYQSSEKNIVDNWIALGVFMVIFSVLSTLVLELIDKDKR